ncbi:MAG: extracellular solute-binding protein [Treponema sp.]|jgi:multiple sugar transport system substrate-binding protein|nr:extracellular solute-binding protein [Treponema sp.]
MTKNLRLQSFALGMCFIGIVFSTCSSRNTESQRHAGQARQEEIVLQFWHHYSAQSPENDTLVTVLIPQFEKENPGITVNAVSHEWANLHDKILISAQSKTLPDVARLDSAWIPEFHAMNILMPLDTEVADFTSTAGNLLESAMSTARIGGHYYGLALNTNTKILFYNAQAFAAANIFPPATMEEFISTAKKLAGKNAAGQQVWGYNEPALSGWNLCPFIWSFGGELTNPEQTSATGYINSAQSIAAIETLAGLYAQGAITGWNSGDIPMTDGFGTGRYMMILEGPWKIAELAGAYPNFEYATAPMPAGKGGSHSVLGGEDISMFNSAHKEAAWRFMQFMTGEFAQTEMAKCGQIPVNKAALNNDIVKKADFAPFIEALASARSRPTVAAWNEMDNGLAMEVSAVISGKKDAKTAMNELARQWDALLRP